VPPLHQRQGGTHSPAGGEVGWGVNILEDSRHWIGLLQFNHSSKASYRFSIASGMDLLVLLLLASFFYAPDLPFLVNTPVFTPFFIPALVGPTFVFPVMPTFGMPLAGFVYTPGWLHVWYAPGWAPV